MGNDGGSIPKRRELVREAARAPTTTQLKASLAESQSHAWTHCALTSKPLAAPVVSDALGKLYNKDSVLEWLLAEADSAEKIEGEKVLGGRVSGLRDVVEVKFATEAEGEGEKEGKAKWICPVTRVEMGPGVKACYLVPCGHAFSGAAVREVKGERCVECDEPFAENDVVPIVPSAAEEIARLNLRIKTLREKGLTHALKKVPGSKKKRKAAEAEAEANGEAKAGAEDAEKKKERKEKERKNDGGIKNASTAYLTKKVMEEQEERNKRRRLEQNDNVRSLFKKGEQKPDLKNSRDYMTRGFSLAK